MTDILQRIVEHKHQEVADMPEKCGSPKPSERDFVAAVKRGRSDAFPRLIAEIKPASPVTGRILPEDVDIGQIAAMLENSGAAALSVLTDRHFFGGGFENLRAARDAVDIPLLCKDFIIDAKQVRLARAYGADSFLLIAKILTAEEIQSLLEEGRKYRMEALVEIADAADLQKLRQTDAKLIGINNRDLRDFSVDLSRTFRLAKVLTPSSTVISLSGFYGADVRLVREVADAVLVGSNIGRAIAKLPKDPLLAEANALLKRFLSPSPLVKFCGVRSVKAARAAIDLRADLLGLNFVPTSKRCITEAVARQITAPDFSRGTTRYVGVFQNQPRDFVQNICSKYRLSFAQLSGNESPAEFAEFPFPLIKGISVAPEREYAQEIEQWSQIADLFLFDGKHPGAGRQFPHRLLPETHKPFLVAGGITPENAGEIQKKTASDGVDTASGIEDEKGEWNWKLMLAMAPGRLLDL